MYIWLCLQAVDHTFHRRTMLVAETVNHIIQHLSFTALTAIGTAKVSQRRQTGQLSQPSHVYIYHVLDVFGFLKDHQASLSFFEDACIEPPQWLHHLICPPPPPHNCLFFPEANKI